MDQCCQRVVLRLLTVTEWYQPDVIVAATAVGTSRTQEASKSVFTGHLDEVELMALWCHGERFPDTKENPIGWNRVTCGRNGCHAKRSRDKKKGKNTIPYYDVRVGGQLLRHVMLVVQKKKCNRCDQWYESESFGSYCSAKCKQNAWESHPGRETSTAGPVTSLGLTT